MEKTGRGANPGQVDKIKKKGKWNAISCSSKDTWIAGGVVSWSMNIPYKIKAAEQFEFTTS